MSVQANDVVWVDLGVGMAHEQGGRRPAVVVASDEYLDAVDSLVVIMPVTSRDRGWPNHVRLTGPTGLDRPSFAMTEQPRTISRQRIVAPAGFVDEPCMSQLRQYLRDFFDL